MSLFLRLFFCLAGAVSLLAGEAAAQAEDEIKQPLDYQELLERLEDLELQVELLGKGTEGMLVQERSGEGEPSPGRSQGLQGMGIAPGQIGSLGQTDRFSTTFNPAIGLVLDTILNYQTGDESYHGQDGFYFRAAELSINAQIDPFGYAYAVLEGSEGEGIGVTEAAGVLNRLPWNLSVKAGRILADHGKLGQRHEHELPFVEKPGVYYDYLGGSVQATGAELHHWFGLTDEIPVRWSLGIYTEADSHSHQIGGVHHDHDHDDVFHKRHMDNYAYNMRLTGYSDLTEETSLQLGTSLLWTPEVQHEVAENRQAVYGIDATWKWQDPAARKELYIGAEAFVSNGRFFEEDEGSYFKHEAAGGYLWGDYSWNPYWSAGAMADLYQMSRHSDVGQKAYSTWLTWKVSHYNWLRMQYRFVDMERGEHEHMTGDDHHEVMFQWIIVIGSHTHGMDW